MRGINAGNSERAGWPHLARSGSQLEHRIRFILPAGAASDIIKNAYLLSYVGLDGKTFDSRLWFIRHDAWCLVHTLTLGPYVMTSSQILSRPALSLSQWIHIIILGFNFLFPFIKRYKRMRKFEIVIGAPKLDSHMSRWCQLYKHKRILLLHVFERILWIRRELYR